VFPSTWWWGLTEAYCEEPSALASPK